MVSKWKSLLFLFVNGILPAIDVLTDVFTFVELLDSNNPKWAATTLAAILLPFTAKAFMFLGDLFQGKANLDNLVGLFLHFPLVSPLIFITLGLYLLTLDSSKAKHSATIETINKIAGLGSLYESFFESGPQLLVQLNITSCTGRITITQLVSMCASIITLSMTSARAFFIQRDVVNAEPAPNVHMLLKTLPWTFTLVMSSASQWTYVVDVKEFIFAAFFLTAAVVWLALWIYVKIMNKLSSQEEVLEVITANDVSLGSTQEPQSGIPLLRMNSGNETPLEAVITKQPTSKPREEPAQEERPPISLQRTCGAFCACVCSFNMFCLLPCTPNCCPCHDMSFSDVVTRFKDRFTPSFNDYSYEVTNLFRQPVNSEDNRYFNMKACLTALLVPCVVGKRERPHTFLVAAVTSIFMRLLFVIFTATVHLNLPPFLRKRTSLFFCTNEQELQSLNMTPTCIGFDCLHFCSSASTLPQDFSASKSSDDCFTQRFRQCTEENEYPWHCVTYSMIALTTFLSLLSAYQLHRLSNYTTLYEASKGCLCSLFFEPVVHRSLLFSAIREVNAERLRSFLEHVDLTRQDHNGYSPVHMAIILTHKDTHQECLALLLKARASPDADSKGLPLYTALQNDDYQAVAQLLLHEVSVVPSFDGLWPSNRYGDSHTAFEDGRSRVVSLIGAEREELVVNLFAKQQESLPENERSNLGVQHLVFGHSELACCLKLSDNKAALKLFEPSIPLTNFAAEEGQSIVRDLLEKSDMKIEDEGFWFKGRKLEAEAWSDRELYLTHGRLTGLQLAIDEKHNCITELRSRFGADTWGEWRTTSPGAGRANNPLELLLETDDFIEQVTSRTDTNGYLAGLEIVTMKSENAVLYGTRDNTNRTRVKTVTKKMPLLFLSGKKAAERPEKYQLTFHWEEAAPCNSVVPRGGWSFSVAKILRR